MTSARVLALRACAVALSALVLVVVVVAAAPAGAGLPIPPPPTLPKLPSVPALPALPPLPAPPPLPGPPAPLPGPPAPPPAPLPALPGPPAPPLPGLPGLPGVPSLPLPVPPPVTAVTASVLWFPELPPAAAPGSAASPSREGGPGVDPAPGGIDPGALLTLLQLLTDPAGAGCLGAASAGIPAPAACAPGFAVVAGADTGAPRPDTAPPTGARGGALAISGGDIARAAAAGAVLTLAGLLVTRLRRAPRPSAPERSA